MSIRKNNHATDQEEERLQASHELSSDSGRISDADETRLASNEFEGEEDYEDDELTEADFAVDAGDEESEEDEM